MRVLIGTARGWAIIHAGGRVVGALGRLLRDPREHSLARAGAKLQPPCCRRRPLLTASSDTPRAARLLHLRQHRHVHLPLTSRPRSLPNPQVVVPPTANDTTLFAHPLLETRVPSVRRERGPSNTRPLKHTFHAHPTDVTSNSNAWRFSLRRALCWNDAFDTLALSFKSPRLQFFAPHRALCELPPTRPSVTRDA